MDLLKLAIGLALFGFAITTLVYLSHQGAETRHTSPVQFAVPAVLVIYFIAAWSVVSMSTWWVVPVGIAGAAVLALVASRGRNARPGS